MLESYDATSWASLLLGLFTVASAAGALRHPGVWQKLVRELDQSPALQLLSGGMELAIGAAIYLAVPWLPSDLLACVMKAIGGLMMIEALVVLAFSDIYIHFWVRNLSHLNRGWAIFSLVIGLALTVAGTVRFH